MEVRTIFYDKYFEQVDVAGLFSTAHFIYIGVFILLSIALIGMSRGISESRERKNRFWIAVAVTLLEIIKIWIRIKKGQGISSWIPLYYCSLFIFASWASLAKNRIISGMGKSYIAMGGAMAGIIFTIIPSTSLAIFPALHPASIHSFLYHFIMFYSGVILLMRGGYKPRARDGILYFLFITLAMIPSFIINEKYGANCMFLKHPYGVPFLEAISEVSVPLYVVLVYLGQGVLMFYGNYLFYLIARALSKLRSPKTTD